jgi:hypothetical protein
MRPSAAVSRIRKWFSSDRREVRRDIDVMAARKDPTNEAIAQSRKFVQRARNEKREAQQNLEHAHQSTNQRLEHAENRSIPLVNITLKSEMRARDSAKNHGNEAKKLRRYGATGRLYARKRNQSK